MRRRRNRWTIPLLIWVDASRILFSDGLKLLVTVVHCAMGGNGAVGIMYGQIHS